MNGGVRRRCGVVHRGGGPATRTALSHVAGNYELGGPHVSHKPDAGMRSTLFAGILVSSRRAGHNLRDALKQQIASNERSRSADGCGRGVTRGIIHLALGNAPHQDGVLKTDPRALR